MTSGLSTLAGDGHPLDQLEVLARLLFVPGRGAGRERHQVERRVVDRMANDAPRMAFTLGKEDGLYLGLEELVIQRAAAAGKRPVAVRLPHRPSRRQEQTRRDGDKDDALVIWCIGTSRIFWLANVHPMPGQ